MLLVALWFLLALLVDAGLMFSMVFNIILFSDLECDYINPIDLCNRLNKVAVPEHLAHAALTVGMLLTGNWLAFLGNVPLLAYHLQRIAANRHMYDATEVFRLLRSHKVQSFSKLAFYSICFFYYLYRLILALVLF